jgi:hypothetical protein
MNTPSIIPQDRKLRSFYELSLDAQHKAIEFAEKLVAEVLRERMTARPETAAVIISAN